MIPSFFFLPLVAVLLKDDYFVRGAGLPGRFKAEKMEFHWGHSNGSAGSEHSINGRRFPVEVKHPVTTIHFDKWNKIGIFRVNTERSRLSGTEKLFVNALSSNMKIKMHFCLLMRLISLWHGFNSYGNLQGSQAQEWHRVSAVLRHIDGSKIQFYLHSKKHHQWPRIVQTFGEN